MNWKIDALVAEKVMGIADFRMCRDEPEQTEPCLFDTGEYKHGDCSHIDDHGTNEGCSGYQSCPVPYYSEDIAAAWEVVEKMKSEGWSFRYGNNALANARLQPVAETH
jgi:hypothetical protein